MMKILQSENGGYPSYRSKTKSMQYPEEFTTPFFNSFALDGLVELRNILTSSESQKEIKAIGDKLTVFLLSNAEPNGLFRFFGPSTHLPPDIDDTSCVWSALLRYSSLFQGQSKNAIHRIKDQSDIIYNWIRKYKPSAGDIDIQVSNDSKRFSALKKVLNNISILKSISSEENLLSTLKQKCKSNGDICVIDNKPSIGQIITAAAVRQSNEVTTLSDFLFFQMDWEPVNADEDGVPTEFSKLSRNSTIEDIEVGIKGREHKYLLRALSNILSDVANEKLKILSPKTLNELKRDESGMFSFSINYGLRKKFWNPNDKNDLNSIIEYYKENVKTKNPLSDKEIKEKIVKSEIRVEIPTEKKEYINDVNSIAKSLGLKKIDSFVNLVSQIQELTKTNKSLGSNILTKFQKKLTEQLTIAPHTFKNGTISEKIDKAFEEDYNVKVGAYKLLHKSIIGNLNISSFDKHYNSWKEKMKTNLIQSNGKFEEKEVE